MVERCPVKADVAGSNPAARAKLKSNCMLIDKDLVKKVADLSKVTLEDSEVEHFAKEMAEVLSYADQLSEVDVTDAAPTDQVTGLLSVFREDLAIDYPADKRAKLLNTVPKFENGYVVVPKVI